MCEKNKRVSRWLGSVFGAEAIPEFEVNTRTIELLDQLTNISELRCKEAAFLTEDYRQKAAEYSSDATYLQEVLLQGVGLQSGSISKTTLDFLSVLEGTAEALKVKDTSMGSPGPYPCSGIFSDFCSPDPEYEPGRLCIENQCSTNFVPAINKLTNDLLEAEKTDKRLKQELSAVRKKMVATMILRKRLQEDLEKITQAQQVEAATAEERLLNVDFMRNKSRDLKYRNKLAQEKLASRQMKDSLTHQAIMQLSEKITALKQEIAPLKKKLEPYNDLSPSPALARVRIEEVKRELAALDVVLEQKVDFLNALSK